MTAFAEEIRAAAQNLLEADAIARAQPYKLVRNNWGWSLGTEDFPALSVFLPRELMNPDGDANAGEPRFVHDCTLGVVISLGFARPEELIGQLAERADPAMDALLQTPAFLMLFESVQRIEAVTVFDRDGETFIAERQINLTIRFRTDWPPNVPDDFLDMAVRLKRPGQPVPADPTLIIPISQETTP